MIIIGHGIDLTEVQRIARLHAEHGPHFLDRCFTAGEQAYCLSHQRRRAREGPSKDTDKDAVEISPADIRLAGRFAAKEAVLKALGTGWRGQIAWTDMEILNAPSGRPALTLSGECRRIAGALGITSWQISISHTGTHAIGSAIACGPSPEPFREETTA